MTKNYSVRTDLALEERERFESDQVEISGVILEEDYDESSETRITRVIIETENGAKAMGTGRHVSDTGKSGPCSAG